MKIKNLLINVGLSIASIGIFFLILESTLRITGMQTIKPNPPKIYQTSDDKRISFELIPNIQKKAYREIVTTDSNGFRTVPGKKIDTNKKLIAVLGDSIAFGYGVSDNQTLAAQINNILPEYNVINAAVPAYQLLQETAVFETKIKHLNPNILILVFYFNDFTDETAKMDDMGVIRAEDWVPANEQCQPIEKGILKYMPGKCWLDLHSAFYKSIKKIVNIRYMNETLKATREKSKLKPEEDNVTKEDLDLYKNQLASFGELIGENTKRIFVIWPDRFMHEQSRPGIRQIAENEGFFVIDLYDKFSNEAQTLGWDTVHPSAETIKEAAKFIVDKINFKFEIFNF